MSLTIRPTRRQQGIPFTCHLATVKVYFAHHKNCDGKSYSASITDPGIPCQCDCHTPTEWETSDG